MTSSLEGFLGKLEVTNEIGEALDKQRQQVEDQAQQLLGGSAALKAGAAKVGALGEHISKDLEEGKLQFGTELEVAAYAKEWLSRAGEVLLNLAEKSKSEELVAHGKAAAIRSSMEVVGRHCKAAKARAEQLVAQAEEAEARAKGDAEPTEEPVEDGPRGRARMPGERPGPSPLDDRRAQARAEMAQTEPEAPAATDTDSQAKLPVEPPTEEPDKPLVEQPPAAAPKPPVKKKVKKRGAKKRAKTNRKPPPARVPAPQG